MTSAVYPLGKSGMETAVFNLTAGSIMVALINLGSYTYSTAHQYWSSASIAVVGTPQTLASPVVSFGVYSGANVTFTAVSGSTVSAIILYQTTGTASTSPLLCYIDGISVVPNGGNIIISWDTGVNKIFAL